MLRRFSMILTHLRGAGWTFAYVLAGLVFTAGSALAVGPGGGGGGGGGGVGGTGAAVPEISASAAVSALTLLAGGTLILADRIRRRAR